MKEIVSLLCRKPYLFSVAFVIGCAGAPKYLPPEIPAQQAKIYIEPFKNMSTIELADGFPRDSVLVQVLFQNIELAHQDLVNEIRLHGKHGSYRVVDEDGFPTLFMYPVLMPYKLEEGVLQLPVFIKVVDKNTGYEFKKQFDIMATYPGKTTPKNRYHFWGILLSEWKRQFPYKKIAGLFYSLERK